MPRANLDKLSANKCDLKKRVEKESTLTRFILSHSSVTTAHCSTLKPCVASICFLKLYDSERDLLVGRALLVSVSTRLVCYDKYFAIKPLQRVLCRRRCVQRDERLDRQSPPMFSASYRRLDKRQSHSSLLDVTIAKTLQLK